MVLETETPFLKTLVIVLQKNGVTLRVWNLNSIPPPALPLGLETKTFVWYPLCALKV